MVLSEISEIKITGYDDRERRFDVTCQVRGDKGRAAEIKLQLAKDVTETLYAALKKATEQALKGLGDNR